MTTPGRPGEGDDWLPSGFPPRTFARGSGPIVPAAPPPPPTGGPRPGRARWLAAAAALIALLLLAAVLALATRGDDDGDELATGTSTSSPLESTTSIDLTTSSIEPVSTTAAGGATTTVAVSPARPGVLEPSTGTLEVPRADATAGPTRATLALKNTGGTALTYSTASSSPGLTAAPAQGTIAPGGSTTVTVTVDAARINTEGPFAGTLRFSGTGGEKTVQVSSTVGRPPEIVGTGVPCEQRAKPCSRQIEYVGSPNFGANPCNSVWVYSVTIDDQSGIQRAGVIARRGLASADTQLGRLGSTNIFQSVPQPPIENTLTLRFTIGAVDDLGYGRQLPEERITC